MGEDPPRPGTDGYPRGTDWYLVSPATPSDESSPDPGDEEGGETEEEEEGSDESDQDGSGERSPYWAGYESPEAFFDHIEAERAKIQDHWEAPPRRRNIPTPDFPRGAEIAGSEGPAPRQVAVRQVGVKLRPVDYDLLARAAELCGVAPSTLARMLVRRGSQAIVDRDRSGGERVGREPG